jgi:hypothetical protein
VSTENLKRAVNDLAAAEELNPNAVPFTELCKVFSAFREKVHSYGLHVRHTHEFSKAERRAKEQ